MSYFSRLTDIVTCNLTDLLGRESRPQEAIKRIIREMEEGVAGARRSASTASASAERLAAEMNEHRTQIVYWTAKAKEELAQKREEQARSALTRKREIEDLIAALQEQHAAALSTREHLDTTRRALEVRLAEAQRKQQELLAQLAGPGGSDTGPVAGDTASTANPADRNEGREIAARVDRTRAAQIEADLEALRRELGAG